jgi:hypothetical protein
MALEPCGVEVVGLPVRRGFKGTLKTYAASPGIPRVLCSRLCSAVSSHKIHPAKSSPSRAAPIGGSGQKDVVVVVWGKSGGVWDRRGCPFEGLLRSLERNDRRFKSWLQFVLHCFCRLAAAVPKAGIGMCGRSSVVPLEKDVVRNGLSSACCAVDFIITEYLIGLCRRGRSQLAVADMRAKIFSWDEAKANIKRRNASKKGIARWRCRARGTGG